MVTIVHTDSYVINSENFRNLNDQLKNGCVLVQGYGIRNPAAVHYEAFPFSYSGKFVLNAFSCNGKLKGFFVCNIDSTKQKWISHKGVQNLEEILNLKETCGYITFVNTGVGDIGCEQYDPNVHLVKPKRNSGAKERRRSSQAPSVSSVSSSEYIVCFEELTFIPHLIRPYHLLYIHFIFLLNQPNPIAKTLPELASPMDGSEITSFNLAKTLPNTLSLKSPDENHFAMTSQNQSPANVYRSDDCNEILAKELEQLDVNEMRMDRSPDSERYNLVSQSSIEIEFCDPGDKNGDELSSIDEEPQPPYSEEWTILDVHFGIPLFDIDCNTRICENLVKNLCNDQT